MNGAEEAWMRNNTLYGLMAFDDERPADYDPEEAAEARRELDYER